MEFRKQSTTLRRPFQPSSRPTIRVRRNNPSSSSGTSAARALNFDHVTGFYGSRGKDFQWKPGQTLPSPESRADNGFVFAPETPDLDRYNTKSSLSCIVDELSDFQKKMDSKLQTMCDKMTNVIDRMTAMETRQKTLEEEVRQSISSSSPAPSGSNQKRKRNVPLALQSRIRAIHKSFDDDHQFMPDEPITSKHNVAVTKKIQDAITASGDSGFSPDIVQKGCKTYRKTLAAREKQASTPVKRQKLARSMKQRSYERRARMVRSGKEMAVWSTITPEMMSDEEKDGDMYIRHPPSYRSQKFNNFLCKLDERADKTNTKSHARFQRKKGSPRMKTPPVNLKKWMKKNDETDLECLSDEEETPAPTVAADNASSEDLFSDADLAI